MPEESSTESDESTSEDIQLLPTPGSPSPSPPLREVEDRLFRKPKADAALVGETKSTRPAIKLTHRQELEQLFRGNPAN